GRSHSRIAAYLQGIRSSRVFFRSNAVAASPLVMYISATSVNERIMEAPWLCRAPSVFQLGPDGYPDQSLELCVSALRVAPFKLYCSGSPPRSSQPRSCVRVSSRQVFQ